MQETEKNFEKVEGVNCYPEGIYLDFKREMYRLDNKDLKAKFVKDIISFSNTPREKNSYIITGVAKTADGTSKLIGIKKNELIDDAKLREIIELKVNNMPKYEYYPFSYDGKLFAIFEIPPNDKGPIEPTRNCGNILQRCQIYYRYGSKNTIADADMKHKILGFFSGSQGLLNKEEKKWEHFLDAAFRFESRRKYILASSPVNYEELCGLEGIGLVPWCFIIDLDPYSESKGLLKSIKETIETKRMLHLIKKGDQSQISPDSSAYCFFARGLEGFSDTHSTGSYRQWLKDYKQELNKQLNQLALAISPSPLTCILIIYDLGLLNIFKACIAELLSVFGDNINFIIFCQNSSDLLSISGDYDIEDIFDFPLSHLGNGLSGMLGYSNTLSDIQVTLPTNSGVEYRIGDKDRFWIEEDLEIVHLGIGKKTPTERHCPKDFYRGLEVTWYELNLNEDIQRNKTIKIIHRLRNILQDGRIVRYDILHTPGAGGTTVAKRVMWDLHTEFPCLCIKRYVKQETIEKIYKIYSYTQKPILILMDSSKISEREIKDLYDEIKIRNTPVALLTVLRRFMECSESTHLTFLESKLKQDEVNRFINKYERIVPERLYQLENIKNTDDECEKNPFFIALTAFEENFLGLSSFVKTRIKRTSDKQKNILLFIALSYHYGQKPLPIQTLANYCGLPLGKIVNVYEILPNVLFDFIVQDPIGSIRPRHELICLEILRQILVPGNFDKRLWKQELSKAAIEFIDFCSEAYTVPSNEVLEILRRSFIYRDNIELLGTEKAESRYYSQLIEDIPSREGKLRVLESLTKYFPEEAHFWAHLGRFLSAEMKDFGKAIECLDKAICNNEGDHVLHHMKGMILREKLKEMISNKIDIDDLVNTANKAGDSFSKAREINADDEHGYISDIQMIIKLLDYIGQDYKDGIFGYIKLAGADPRVQELLDKAENLFDQARRKRAGYGPSNYEKKVESKLYSLYKDYSKALQSMHNLLDRSEFYKPPIRRQIVWTHLSRNNRNWFDLNEKNIKKIINLLEANLQEEPYDERNLRLWVQAVRRSKKYADLDLILEKIGYWHTNTSSIDSSFYLYVFHSLKAINGSKISTGEAKKYIDECKKKARNKKNRFKSLEWYGCFGGKSMYKLVPQSELGAWDINNNFWKKSDKLIRLKGKILRIQGPQKGTVTIECGLPAFFVPSVSNFSKGKDENINVNFFLGFSYDGLRAWDLKRD